MDRGAWWATVCRVAELDTTEVTQHIAHLGLKHISDCGHRQCGQALWQQAQLSPVPALGTVRPTGSAHTWG